MTAGVAIATLVGVSPADAVELAAEPLVADTVEASLIQMIDAAAWDTPAMEPSGIVWHPSSRRLIVVDSEINEVSGFQNVNMWHINHSGTVFATGATTGPASAGSYSNEPTGLGYDASTDTLFISDDTASIGAPVHVVKPGLDGQFGTTDDEAVSINLRIHGATDTEDPEFDPVTGHLFVLSGVDREIFRIDPVDGIFGDGNDIITSFDISHLGPTDFEAMTSSPSRRTLYVGAHNTDQIFEITHDGQLVRTINVNIPGLRFISGLAIAPSSVNPSVMSLWIVDRGKIDTTDGKILEIAVPDLGGLIGNLGPCGADLPAAGFLDVSAASPHAIDIDCLVHVDVAQGIGNGLYDPLGDVTRWQMALFLVRTAAVLGLDVPETAPQFADLDSVPDAAKAAIGSLAAMGVTTGTSPTGFSPFARVNRAQMALFLMRLHELTDADAPSSTPAGFQDLGALSDETVLAINQIADLRVTAGTSPTTYSPFDVVTRQQMASLLARLIRLVD